MSLDMRMAGAREQCVSFLLVAMLVPATATASRPLPLVPYPLRIDTRPGRVDLAREWRVDAGSRDSSDLRVAATLVEEARTRGWPWRLGKKGSGAEVRFRARPSRQGETPLEVEQGYSLIASRDLIEICAPTPTGRFYGAQTLRQLLRGTDGQVPMLTIEDAPSLAVRGVSDDVSRGQMSTTTDFLAIIRMLAFYKINLYQPYLQSSFRFRSAPGVSVHPTLQPEELAAIVKEGDRCHVRVVPILETLAHQDELLASPAYKALSEAKPNPSSGWLEVLAERFRPYDGSVANSRDSNALPDERSPASATFCATNPAAQRLALALIDDVARVTTDPWFHAGGDECDAIATGRSAGAVRARGFGAVYVDWFAAIRRHLASRGRRTMLYADMALAHADALALLPRDVVMVDWEYQPADSFAALARLRAAGFRDVLASPGLWNWRSFYPHYARAFPNVARAADAARRAGASGCVTASWTDGGTESLREFNWTGYAYGAASTWESRAPDPEGVIEACALLRFGPAGVSLAIVEKALDGIPPPPQGWWGRAFHRPLAFHRLTPEWSTHVVALQRRMNVADSTLRRIRTSDRSTSFALLCHAVTRFRFLADRDIAIDTIARRLEARPSKAPFADRVSARELRALADRLRAMNDEFRRLWLAHNRPGALAKLQQRLRTEEGALRAAAVRAETGRLTLGSAISSPSIVEE